MRCDSYIRVINTARGQIEEGTAPRLAFVHNYMSRDADRPDAGNLDTCRGYGKTVDACSGVGGASITNGVASTGEGA